MRKRRTRDPDEDDAEGRREGGVTREARDRKEHDQAAEAAREEVNEHCLQARLVVGDWTIPDPAALIDLFLPTHTFDFSSMGRSGATLMGVPRAG